jgi:hypothetical protein
MVAPYIYMFLLSLHGEIEREAERVSSSFNEDNVILTYSSLARVYIVRRAYNTWQTLVLPEIG